MRRCLRDTYIDYKKQNDLITVKYNVEAQEKVVLKYKIFAMQIECLASLLNCSDEEKQEQCIEGSPKGFQIYDLMQIAGNFRTDPLILTAICKLTLKTLEVKKDDCRKLEIIVGNIKQCT